MFGERREGRNFRGKRKERDEREIEGRNESLRERGRRVVLVFSNGYFDVH